MPPPPPPRRGRALAWVAVLAAVAAATAGLDAAGVRDAALFGALLVGLAVALLVPPRRLPGGRALRLPRLAASCGQAVIGVLIGALVQPATLTALADTWPAVLGTVALTLLVSVLAGLVLSRHPDVDVVTGCFALIAGGASGVTAMSREMGADQRVVAVVQYLRVLLVVLSMPLVAAALPQPGADGAGAADAAAAVTVGPGWPADLLLTAVCAGVGLVLSRRLRLPAGSLLWPLVLSTAASATGLSGGAGVPAPLLVAAFAAVGLDVGLTFTRASLGAIARVLPLALTCTVGVIVATAAVSIPLLRLAGASPLDAYLASTPGGLYAVLAVSVSSGADTTLVLAVQVLRLVVMVVAAPLLATLLRGRAGP